MSSNVKNSGDFEQGSVNQESRRGFMSMLVVMLGFTFFSASMFAGGALGVGMSFSGFLWAVMAGNLILGAYCGTLAYIAARTGDSIHILARYSFWQARLLSSQLPPGHHAGWLVWRRRRHVLDSNPEVAD